MMAIVAITAVAGRSGDAPQVLTIESENGARGFGSMFAADGATILSVDYTRGCADRRRRGCAPILRFGHLDTGRYVETTREISGSGVMALDVAGDTAVVRFARLRDQWLELFDRHGDAWGRGQKLALPARCHTEYRPGLHLGSRVLVVESDDEWCLFVRDADGWRFDGAIHHGGGRSVGVSRDRLVELHPDRIELRERTPRGWEITRTIAVRPGELGTPAVHGRWLAAASTSARELYVYDLDAGALATTLPSQLADDDLAAGVAAGDTTIVAIGRRDQHWRFLDGAWRPAGFLDGITLKSAPVFRHAEVADRVWVGNPALEDGPCGGTIHGFPAAI